MSCNAEINKKQVWRPQGQRSFDEFGDLKDYLHKPGTVPVNYLLTEATNYLQMSLA